MVKFISSKKNKVGCLNKNIGLIEDRVFKYFISYIFLVIYVIACLLKTTDLMLLSSVGSMYLPLVNVPVSVVHFYIIAPIVVASASLYMAREFFNLEKLRGKCNRKTDFIFSNKGPFSGDKLFGVNGVLDAYFIRVVSIFLFFFMGPVVVLLLAFRFADYQDPMIFFFHIFVLSVISYFSWVFYQRFKGLYGCSKRKYWVSAFVLIVTFFIFLKLLFCFDVIFIPAKNSFVMYLRQNTKFLDGEDGGIVSLVPHIKIDRTTKIWEPPNKSYDEIAYQSHSGSSNEYFVKHVAAVDIRGRNLKYLDIGFQVVPRVWAHEADLSGANLSFTKMAGSNFIGTKMYGVNLSMAILDGSRFFGVDIEGADFYRSYARGVVFDNVKFSSSLIEGVNFTGSSFFGVKFSDSIVNGSDFSGVDFYNTIIKDSYFSTVSVNYIFPWSPGHGNVLNDYSEAFVQDESEALKIIAKQFCKEKMLAADVFALQGLSEIYGLLSRANDDRLDKLKRVLEEMKCKQAVNLIKI